MRKTQEEVKEELFRRRERYEAGRRTRRNRLFGGSAVLLVCLAVVLLLGRIPLPSPDTVGGESSQAGALSAGPSEQSGVDKPENAPTQFDLMANIRPLSVSDRKADDAFVQAQMKFALALLRNTVKEKREALESMREGGVLLCPLSAELALSMTANGAEGETLRQMEEVLGGGIPIEQLNEYLRTYTAGLPSAEGSKLELANSIWLRTDRPAPFEEFLQTNANYYGAGAFRAPFDDLCDRINDWVKKQTDGMIEKLFSELPEDTIMVLVNTVLFDGAWQTAYEKKDLWEGSFTAYDGTNRTVTMMPSTEDVAFRGDDGTIGFLKPYKNPRYAFVALLPKEGVDILDYASTLNAGTLKAILRNPIHEEIKVTIPKFSFSGEQTLNDALKAMGMPRAFDAMNAEFTKMFPGNDVFLSFVQQNTAIEVSETGTKAAAATGGGFVSEAYFPPLVFNRPFVYMILDTETNIPLFLGILTDIR